ncbi:arylsulfotransferase family protein [Sphingomonas sanxanigenens]|uniref:Arylsulfotransferase N-terminal domain-containing protein n=1 Tax=Sphingomonas sanxanigenens DSM 19645 = NX02 TaxID=1123269 RepID=W0A806_9SPHN|nr:arylsulfotransferase family protein [Sphingomonas sanxanigenens]AHE51800.1 hypothetical protein NX02_00155 [Sphingomonas sanxanigenens DSM 19645 = NX02]
MPRKGAGVTPAKTTNAPAAVTARGRFERLMDWPVPFRIVALLAIAALVILIWFSWMARYPSGHGRIGAVALELSDVPNTIQRVFKPDNAPVTTPQQKLPTGFRRNTRQPYVDKGHVLVSHYSAEAGRYVVRLMRLDDGRILHEYRPDAEEMIRRSKMKTALVDLPRDRNASRNRLLHPLLMADGGLILQHGSPLFRVDACGRVLWTIDGVFHHSLERGLDRDLWAAYTFPQPRERHVRRTFRDDAIAHVSEDGRMLGRTRIAEILDANGLGHLWRSRPYTDDPFHLNDVEPVRHDSAFWKRGDLFLSMRNLSLVMLYRPSTNRILWWRDRPFSFQHDINVLDDGRISIFDNHASAGAPGNTPLGPNRVLVYDFRTDRFEQPFARAMTREKIQTSWQGRATPLPDNGDMMVEETVGGRLLRIAPDGTVRWRYVAADAKGDRYMLGWSRYLGDTDAQGIARAQGARCE